MSGAKQQGQRIVVIGAGIGGLTAAALLAHRGYQVKIFDQASVPGGCASTFKRKGFTFDVGATQVAGLEPGGIHYQIFKELDLDLPAASLCDPACAVYLPGEKHPINVWRDPQRWQQERARQFPGSEPFWQFMQRLFAVSWRFQQRDPVLPPCSGWDMWQLFQAVRPETLITLPFALSTVGESLRGFGLYENRRLRTFLDMQLKLYSQTDANHTALLYAATALGVSQAPHGLYHLEGSMQVLSDRLVEAFRRDGGVLAMRHRVNRIKVGSGGAFQVNVTNAQGESWWESADQVVANVTVQNLVELGGSGAGLTSAEWAIDSPSVAATEMIAPETERKLSAHLPNSPESNTFNDQMRGYQKRVARLPSPSGAFVIYLGVDQAALPVDCPPHLQFLYDYEGPIGENNSLFVSVSRPGDGRAPEGKATVIASSFTDVNPWYACDQTEYRAIKARYTEEAISRLKDYFDLRAEHIVHVEAATPRSFERYTARQQGIVGGIGQRVSTFGPFGFATRTPIRNLWLVGDSTHPGEGTAGVSYSAMTAVRQIEASNRGTGGKAQD